jgi:hypothetical protein
MPRPDEPPSPHPFKLSVSQIETARTCMRKWAFNKIDGLLDDPKPAAILGQAVHDQLEHYLRDGRPIQAHTNPGRIAVIGARFLPAPRTPGMEVEKYFRIEIGPALFRGYMDVFLPPDDIRRRMLPVVMDHKTTGNFSWAKTKDFLETEDVQSGVYAHWAMTEYGATACDLQWTYFKTTGAASAFPVNALMTRMQADVILEGVVDTSQKMLKVLQTCSRALDVTPDPTGCEAFGGCSRKALCQITPKMALKSIMSQGQKANENVLARLKLRKEQGAAAATAAMSTAAVAQVAEAPSSPAPTPVAGKPLSQLEKIRERKRQLDAGAAANEADAVASNVAENTQVNPPERALIKANKPAARNGVEPVWDEAAVAWVFPKAVSEALPPVLQTAATASSSSISIEVLLEALAEKVAAKVLAKLQK